MAWISSKEQANYLLELHKNNKEIAKTNLKLIPNFHDANTKNRNNAILFLCEGLSALAGPLSGKGNSDNIALFPLKGKPINVMAHDLKTIIDNEEFKNIMAITGLKINTTVTNVNQLRFGKICFLSDQDLDGWGIRGLLANLFYFFWPELFQLQVICILNTPIIKVNFKNNTIPFYSESDFHQWKLNNNNDKFTMKYYKGLGSSTSNEWKEYLHNVDDKLQIILPTTTENNISTNHDKELFTLLFSKNKGMSDKRKIWLQQ